MCNSKTYLRRFINTGEPSNNRKSALKHKNPQTSHNFMDESTLRVSISVKTLHFSFLTVLSVTSRFLPGREDYSSLNIAFFPQVLCLYFLEGDTDIQ